MPAGAASMETDPLASLQHPRLAYARARNARRRSSPLRRGRRRPRPRRRRRGARSRCTRRASAAARTAARPRARAWNRNTSRSAAKSSSAGRSRSIQKKLPLASGRSAFPRLKQVADVVVMDDMAGRANAAYADVDHRALLLRSTPSPWWRASHACCTGIVAIATTTPATSEPKTSVRRILPPASRGGLQSFSAPRSTRGR
jgi:hypothetical protein